MAVNSIQFKMIHKLKKTTKNIKKDFVLKQTALFMVFLILTFPFFSARALSQFGTDIISAPFPCGTMSFCLQNTPYVLGEGNIEIISSPATTDFTKVFKELQL